MTYSRYSGEQVAVPATYSVRYFRGPNHGHALVNGVWQARALYHPTPGKLQCGACQRTLDAARTYARKIVPATTPGKVSQAILVCEVCVPRHASGASHDCPICVAYFGHLVMCQACKGEGVVKATK